jgi:hypothetical protein
MTEDSPDSPPTPAEQVQMLFVRHEGAIRAFVRGLASCAARANEQCSLDSLHWHELHDINYRMSIGADLGLVLQNLDRLQD